MPNRALLSLCLVLLVSGCLSSPPTEASLPSAASTVAREPSVERIYPARWFGDRRAACSITFDDGTLDQYRIAAPELDRRGIRATFFVITAAVERGIWHDGEIERLLFGWEEARELAWRGHEIASHSAHHPDLDARPAVAAEELIESYRDLRRELPWVDRFSLGWPYWRASDRAVAAAEGLYPVARAGGISALPEDLHFGGVNGATPTDYMRIGAHGILAADGEAELRPVFDEVYQNGGWLIPNFHGFDSFGDESAGTGWEPLPVATFRRILDELIRVDIWMAPFGEVAGYIQQRDALTVELEQKGAELRVRYTTPLDPADFPHPVTIILELDQTTALRRVVHQESGRDLAFARSPDRDYRINIPSGNGTLILQLDPIR